jgi:hypothetical protein
MILQWIVGSALAAAAPAVPAPAPTAAPPNRVASVFVSEDFINEQLHAHSKSQLIKGLRVRLDATEGTIILFGLLQVPVEELRAIKLDPELGAFRFQMTIKPETTPKGHLILEFPLAETYFYPAKSKDLKHDRVIVPVQMLSLALASVRGYLAALSGDFSGFDRRTAKIEALIKGLEKLIAAEKNPDAKEELRNQLAAQELQLKAVPIERKQLAGMAKEVSHILGFTGEKELNLNNELGARKNALILKVQLSQLAPYLKGVELGGVRLLHDKKDGAGENYLAIDANSTLEQALPPVAKKPPANRAAMAKPPVLIVRLNQALFESTAVVDAEKKSMGTKLKDLDIQLKDDGLHVAGRYRALLFSIPFDTIVDFVSVGTDVFEARVRDLEVAGLDLEFLTGFVLDSMRTRLDTALKGLCTFENIGETKDHARALRVTVASKSLVPAFPDLHLVSVDVRDREFLLKVGRP